jgi:hypothetical protein
MQALAGGKPEIRLRCVFRYRERIRAGRVVCSVLIGEPRCAGSTRVVHCYKMSEAVTSRKNLEDPQPEIPGHMKRCSQLPVKVAPSAFEVVVGFL